MKGIHERDQLGALQKGILPVLVLVEFEEDLQRRAVAYGLQLAPQATLVAPDAIHQPTHVAEPVAEIFFQPAFGALEHDALVEDAWAGGRRVGEGEDLGFGGGVLIGVAGAEGVAAEVGAQFGGGAQEEGVVEVEV